MSLSLLDRIDSILTELEKVHQKLDRLLASGSNDAINLLKIAKEVEKEMPIVEKVIVKGGTTVPKKENTTEEGFEQDFSQALVMKQTELALLVVKKGYQQWLAKSLIKGGGKGYDNGNTYDFVILEISPKSEKLLCAFGINEKGQQQLERYRKHSPHTSVCELVRCALWLDFMRDKTLKKTKDPYPVAKDFVRVPTEEGFIDYKLVGEA